jgi:ketosteroid isomerase-like protein
MNDLPTRAVAVASFDVSKARDADRLRALLADDVT